MIDPLYLGLASASSPIDAYGYHVPDSQPFYTPYFQTVDGVRSQGPLVPNPNYKPLSSTTLGNSGNAPAAAPPNFIFTFDTIGQTIYRSIGHCRLPLRIIWAQGISESGDVSVSNTQTFAAALCAPIDPLEEGEIFAIWDGGSQIFNSGGVVTPAGWSPTDAALLAASLTSVVIFPGDESQLPASLIVADKGSDKTNAFRGIRYIIFQNYPIGGGSGSSGGGLPQLSAGYQRTNDQPPAESGAVEFLAGAS